jgi:hypothetical protein
MVCVFISTNSPFDHHRFPFSQGVEWTSLEFIIDNTPLGTFKNLSQSFMLKVLSKIKAILKVLWV